jgi:isopentenyl phosphate kinase
VLYFLKLGGSLITDKSTPHAVRADTLKRIAGEIADGLQYRQDLQLVIGHGSGSYGHVPAKKYGTRDGVDSAEKWWGFVEVYREARALNQLVLEALLDAGLPIIAFPPSSSVIAADGKIQTWDLQPMQAALAAGLIPLVNGDVIFDSSRGGTILSTEELFAHLAAQLAPHRILLAGIEAGVWADFPACTHLMETISQDTFVHDESGLGGSAAIDVTGGMRQKVQVMLDIAKTVNGLQSLIFSGEEAWLVYQAVLGDLPGTSVRA